MKILNNISIRWRLTLIMAIILIFANLLFALISIMLARDTYDISKEEVHKIYDNFQIIKTETGETKLAVIKREQDDEFAMKNLAYAILIILTGSAATYFISGMALRPILSLNKEVKNLDENNLHIRVNVPKVKDEIWDLAISFNSMVNRLEKAFILQKNFSANAAHELKTPLAGIISSIEVLQMDEVIDTEECLEVLNDVLFNAERLSQLVNNLLEINRELTDLTLERFDLDKLLDVVILENQTELLNKEIQLKRQIDSINIKGDKHLLQRVFSNLLNNSIKYNKKGGYIDICAVYNKDCVVVTIKDTGVGIPASDLDKVFEPFYCVDKSRSRELGGSGLGLSIVKAIVEKHNGNIEVESIVGENTTFILTLPNI